MNRKEKLRLKREKLQIEQEKRRNILTILVWSLVTVLTMVAVLFVSFAASGHRAFAAVGRDVDEPFDTYMTADSPDQSSMPSEQHPLGFIEPVGSLGPLVSDSKGCKADMRWPVLPHVLVRRFKAPVQVWAPGHRGVDIAAVESTPLLAPADGVVSFAGIVAGKSVVSIRHKSLTLTLEPAQTLLPIGTPVVKGLPIGTVTGISDHCTGICVHWGVRKSRKEYRDPEKLVSKRKIVLKPIGTGTG